MQTFLPYPNFEKSAKTLDWRRLGKQRIEAKQIVQILIGEAPNSRWKNHPAVKMWEGHSQCLAQYGIKICEEWIKRGYVDNQLVFFKAILQRSDLKEKSKPIWLGNEGFHASHRSNLLRKKSEWYSKFNWIEHPNLPYVWPLPQ